MFIFGFDYHHHLRRVLMPFAAAFVACSGMHSFTNELAQDLLFHSRAPYSLFSPLQCCSCDFLMTGVAGCCCFQGGCPCCYNISTLYLLCMYIACVLLWWLLLVLWLLLVYRHCLMLTVTLHDHVDDHDSTTSLLLARYYYFAIAYWILYHRMTRTPYLL